MTMMRVDAGRGWGWIVEGWRLFAQAPGIWIVILLIYLGISVVLSLIPFVGGLAYMLLSPVLVGGMLYGAAAQTRGDSLEIAHVFRGFQNQERMGPLVLLGLIGLAGYVVMILVVVMFVGGGLIMGAVMDNTGAVVPPEAVGGLFVGAGLIALLVILTIGLLMTMALFYGIPLVMLGGQDAWPAARDSVAACWVNVLPLLVFGLIYLVLATVAVIPFGLGLLILGPVTVGAVYASYRDVFEDTPTRVNLAK
ncbi:MAG: BPSS1780 family membrane protein [Candidatus Contendobacter sp.]|nr:BPSS1780 family membrane protein [Candidatus Contendobacter sp.]MDG4555930.1 BPSS1780 family membrane protein [Candidatus Contendobacter sp.]